MVKSPLRAAALFLLCLLLVFAPEVCRVISGSFSSGQPIRVFLRINQP